MNETITVPTSAPYAWKAIIASPNNGYWFNKRTMRFFSSRILWATLTPIASDRFLFITSECQPYYGTFYSVREWSPSNGVETLGEFNSHATREDALKALRGYVREEQLTQTV